MYLSFNFTFISVHNILSSSNTHRYLSPLASRSPISLPSSNLIPSLLTAHFEILNSIHMSPLHRCTICTNSSLFPNIFRPTMRKKWLIDGLSSNWYLTSVFHSTYVTGINAIMYINGENKSP